MIKGVPGPGRYDIKSQFEKTESVTPNVNDASHAFLSQSQVMVYSRFHKLSIIGIM